MDALTAQLQTLALTAGAAGDWHRRIAVFHEVYACVCDEGVFRYTLATHGQGFNLYDVDRMFLATVREAHDSLCPEEDEEETWAAIDAFLAETLPGFLFPTTAVRVCQMLLLLLP